MSRLALLLAVRCAAMLPSCPDSKLPGLLLPAFLPACLQVRLTFKNELQQLWVGSAVSTQVRLPVCLPAHLPPCPLPACPLEQTLTRCCVRCRWPHGQSLPGLVRLTVRLLCKGAEPAPPACLPSPGAEGSLWQHRQD